MRNTPRLRPNFDSIYETIEEKSSDLIINVKAFSKYKMLFE